MRNFQNFLKIDVEKNIGFRIKSNTEAKFFEELLFEKGISTISLSTIRRIWGLIPEKKPHHSTLNELAKFLNFKSFLDYVKYKNQYINWYNDVELQKMKYKDLLSASDFKLITDYYSQSGSNLFVLDLIENAISFEKWDYLYDLFNPNNINLNNYNQEQSGYSSKLAYLFSIYLNSIPDFYFNKIIDKIISNEQVKNHCIYIHLDIINLNGRFGVILNKIKLSPTLTYQEKVFLNLITNIWNYLNTDKAIKMNEISEELHSLPDVLKGRYFGYQILYSTKNLNPELELKYWNLFLHTINSETNLRQYLHEFINHLILVKSFVKLEYLLNNYYETIFDNYHVHSYLDIFIFNYIDVVISIKSQEIKRANIIFLNLDATKIQTNSYCDYYLIFYNIIGYHLELNAGKKLDYKNNYNLLAKKTKFKLFNTRYLEEYFIN
jgi:hypothetical protein